MNHMPKDIHFTDAVRDDTSPTQDRVRALFDYDEVTGRLIWRARPLSEFADERICKSWHTRFLGKPAGSISKRGYCETWVDGRLYLGHRLIWLWHHGAMPVGIDHIFGVALGDHIWNLREATQGQNTRNQRRRIDNKSGVTGVRQLPSGRWKADIGNKGCRHIGNFNTKAEAIAARKKAERDLGFHPNHGRAA